MDAEIEEHNDWGSTSANNTSGADSLRTTAAVFSTMKAQHRNCREHTDSALPPSDAKHGGGKRSSKTSSGGKTPGWRSRFIIFVRTLR